MLEGQKPSIGRIVHYRLSTQDAERINAWRADTANNRHRMQRQRPGFQAHFGNGVDAGGVVPMMIVRVGLGDNNVNGQAFLDGNDSLWVTSAKQGDGLGEWSWPPKG